GLSALTCFENAHYSSKRPKIGNGIVFIDDLSTHDLFENIFEGNDPRESPVLINDGADMLFLLEHREEEMIRTHEFRNGFERPRDLAEGERIVPPQELPQNLAVEDIARKIIPIFRGVERYARELTVDDTLP